MVIFGYAPKLHYLIAHFPFALLAALYVFRHHPRKKMISWLLLACNFFLVGTGLGLVLAGELAFPLGHMAGGLGLLAASLWLHFGSLPRVAGGFASFALLAALTSGASLSFGRTYFSPVPHPAVSDLSPTFQRDIRPILDRKCVKCHDPSRSVSRLDLSTVTGMLESKTLLPFVVPGKADKSGFYLTISESVPSARHMPRLSGLLSQGERETVRHWIEADGKLPLPPAAPAFHGAKHWAFRRFSKPAVPEQPGATEIDRFLARSGWRGERAPATLLHRRLALTTTGLAPEKIGKEYSALVNHYLASPHFGENLAAYWFDLVAYAEGPGFDGYIPVSTAAAYKKYVIESLNRDRPLNQFLREQLAATDDAEADVHNPRLLQNQLPQHQDPYITADYAVNSVFAFTLGVEMRCARCHDHRHEPISQKSYYDLVSVFSGAKNLGGRFPTAAPIGKQFLDLYEGTANDLENWRKSESDQKLDAEDLANWMTDEDKGIGLFTSRVFVDHVWRFAFGKGFVEKAGSFGSESAPPAELDLLNWLTYDFIEHGHSIKFLLRRILMSDAFRSRAEGAGGPFAPRRLTAENIRDNLLLSAGKLNLAWGARDIDDRFVPVGKPTSGIRLPEEFGESAKSENNRRSVFYRRPRDLAAQGSFARAFGQPTGFESVPQRRSDPDVKEATFYANDKTLGQVVDLMTKRAPTDRTRLVREAYERILARAPTAEEQDLWRAHFAGDDSRAALKIFFHALLSGAEFYYTP